MSGVGDMRFNSKPAIDPITPLDYPQTMKVSAQYAAAHIADLFLVASNGEEVEIALPDKPALKLVVANPAETLTPSGPRVLGAGRRHLFGAGKGLVTVPTDEQWDAMKKDLAADMLDGPFFPPEHD